ncbi:FAD:protein FMN transferase [Suttonella sp. R2A3]|uniref:FAD:protein FMN transferase n=1 Tax=Suttonella sp. R2A3 TaxID=2908648 RepID=UPI001F2002DD|nr:FAD:protein FMN transferase [Suttonella sp. R2A3]UJF24133.1 FAD:protein FMN transferase [Suttonella sp. R2A3]
MPLLVAVALLFLGCKPQTQDQEVLRLQGETMGTYWQVSVADPVDDQDALRGEIVQVLAEVNQEMSTYIADSAISQFNQRQSTEPQTVSAAFIDNLLAAQTISEQSDGVYDITVAPLVNLWGFGPDAIDEAPSQAAIDAALTNVGYQQLIIDPQAMTLAKINPSVMIDLSSIAKGYGVDAVASRLSELGYQHVLVDIGGEVLAVGQKFGEPWRIAVERPEEGQHVQQVIALNDHDESQMALATSGNYRNYIDYDGARVAHTIDPRTGTSTQSPLLSVSVMASSCMYADGYATALMALGAEAAEAFADKHNIAALFIYADPQDKQAFVVKKVPLGRRRQENNMFNVFIVVFAFMFITVVIMAVGVLFNREPIRGSCGGLNNIGVERACGCKDVCEDKGTSLDDDEAGQAQAPERYQP